MMAIGILAYTVPFASDFFNFNLPFLLMVESALIGLGGILAIEVVRRARAVLVSRGDE